MEVKVPAAGESVTEATVAEVLKNSGEFINRDEPFVVLETDKASLDIVAETSGVLDIKVEEGDTVQVGSVLATIDESASAPAGTPPAANVKSMPADMPTPPPAASQAHPDLKNHMPPAAAKIAAEKGLSAQDIQGTGKDGRITKQDAVAASKSPAPAAQPPAKREIPPLPTVGHSFVEEEERKPMTQLRKTIARRLVESQHTTATLTTFNEIDMTNLYRLRDEYKDLFEKKHGLRLGFMGFFVKAVIEGLKQFPAVNAFIDGNDLVYHNYHNVGIAVGTPKGLVVPVIKNADKMSLAQIEQSIRHYALKARENKISMDDLSGGTFTVSNGGVFGSLMSTPILNPPQSGILGMHKVEERPVAINGKVEIRPMMYVALSYDHRVIDGAESVQFLVRIKECIEDPSRILLEA